MCGRFTQRYTWREVWEYLNLIGTPQNLRPRFNIAPTTYVDVALANEGGMTLEKMRWGLVPAWWKKSLKEVPSTFNARAETVATKPMFRSAFKSRRCLIPMSGFYEWKQGSSPKQPFYISSTEGPVMCAAGLWEQWKDPESGEALKTCTMIVTAADKFMAPLHDRMPVLLARQLFEPWLKGAAGAEILHPVARLQMWPVSTRVNKVGHDDDATLIEHIAI
jgi:putative SOS response-associated peptidase YedK